MNNPTCNCTDRCEFCATQDICCYCYTDHVTRKWVINDTLDDVDIDATEDVPYI